MQHNALCCYFNRSRLHSWLAFAPDRSRLTRLLRPDWIHTLAHRPGHFHLARRLTSLKINPTLGRSPPYYFHQWRRVSLNPLSLQRTREQGEDLILLLFRPHVTLTTLPFSYPLVYMGVHGRIRCTVSNVCGNTILFKCLLKKGKKLDLRKNV